MLFAPLPKSKGLPIFPSLWGCFNSNHFLDVKTQSQNCSTPPTLPVEFIPLEQKRKISTGKHAPTNRHQLTPTYLFTCNDHIRIFTSQATHRYTHCVHPSHPKPLGTTFNTPWIQPRVTPRPFLPAVRVFLLGPHCLNQTSLVEGG